MTRDAFLSRVRQAAAMGRQYRVPIRPFPPDAGYVGCSVDLCQGLAAEINAVGGEATIVPNLPAARDWIAEQLTVHRATTALCWRHPLLEELGLPELLAQRHVAQHDYDSLAALGPAERRTQQLACDVAISSVDVAVAETGSLLVCARPGQERTASLLPPLHLAVVRRDQIVPDLLDAFAWLAQRGWDQLPSNMAFITGPSKTGDIELQLTTGVHGPKHWRVVVIA